MTTPPEFTASRTVGLVGTGAHLWACTHRTDTLTVADVWLTFGFIPLVPLGCWVLERSQGAGSSWTVQEVHPPKVIKSLRTIGAALLTGLLALLPGYVAVAFFMASKVVGLGGAFATVLAVTGVLGVLDQTMERVPLLTAIRVLAQRNGPTQDDVAGVAGRGPTSG